MSEMIRKDLKEQIGQFEKKIARIKELEGEWDFIIDAMMENNKALFDEVDALRKESKECNEKIKCLSLDLFEITEDKQIGHGIVVKLFKKVEYDEEAALKWARTGMPHLVVEKLDKRGFESIVKKTEVEKLKLDFVLETKITPKVTIPKEFKKDGDN